MTVSGTINTIDSGARTANITHGPMTDIGMPGMTMNFAISPDLRIDDLPLEAEVMLLFSKNANFSLTLVGLAEEKVVTQ
jgi:Cu(I)/Ag(I) efflux system membrane fusion protein